MTIDRERFENIYLYEATQWLRSNPKTRQKAWKTNYQNRVGRATAQRHIDNNYNGGLEGFIKDSDQAYRERWKLIAIVDDDNATENYQSDNPLMELRLYEMQSEVINIRDEMRDCLWHYDKNPDSFDDEDVDRIKRFLDDPFMSDRLNDEWVEGGREQYIGTFVSEHEGITINNYNAKVINTYTVPFIDVDTKNKRKVNGLLSELGNMGFGGRLYRTAKGHRVVLRQHISTEELFTTFIPKPRQYGIDLSYVRISKLMGTYRARLTAKPWRIGGPESKFASRSYDHYPVTCFLMTWGNGYFESQPYVDHWQKIMNAHDETAVGNLRHTLY